MEPGEAPSFGLGSTNAVSSVPNKCPVSSAVIWVLSGSGLGHTAPHIPILFLKFLDNFKTFIFL